MGCARSAIQVVGGDIEDTTIAEPKHQRSLALIQAIVPKSET